MNKNPINLAVRFALEIAMLIALAIWGWHLSDSWINISRLLAFLLSLQLYGVFSASKMTLNPLRLKFREF